MIPRPQWLLVSGAAVLSIVTSIAVAQVSVALRGTIESATNQTLLVKVRDGTMTNVKLADDAHVFQVKQASLADLKYGSLVGAASIRQMEGSQKAVEIYIFPDEPRHELDVVTNSIVDGQRCYRLVYP